MFDIVGCADLHLDNSNSSGIIDDNGVNSFLYTKKKVFMEILNKVKELSAIGVVCGDIFNTNMLDTITTNIFNECIAYIISNKLEMIFLGGNHDFDGIRSLIGSYGALKLERIYFVDTPRVINIKGIEFYCVPYMGKTIDQEYEMVRIMSERAANSRVTKKFLLLHYPIIGCKYDAGIKAQAGFNLRAIVENTNPFMQIWAGDFHDRQGLSGVDNFLYLGQPYWSDFSSAGKKRGYTLYDTENKTRKLIAPRDCPRFKIIEGITKASDLMESLDNHIVRIHIDTDVDATSIYDRGYKLGAIKVLVRRNKKKEDIELTEVKYKYSVNRHEAIATFIDNSESKVDKKELIKAGISIINEVRRRSGRNVSTNTITST